MSPATAQDASTTIADSRPRRLGRYLLRYEIATGGMAAVYLAQQGGAQGFGKWVAVKWVHAHLATDARFVAMFIDEARTMSQIDHPSVCQVLDFVEELGTAYIVMEYLHGESLSTVMRRASKVGGLPTAHAVRIAVQVARGLHAAHEATGPDGRPLNVVHRDVSPQNIHVLYSGAVKVLDFGIAKASDRRSEATATGEIKGKIAYMAPEQFHGEGIDRRVDVWALGVVLWEMLTHRRLFRTETDALTMRRVIDHQVPPPSEFREDVSPDLDAVVLRALDRNLATRYQTAAEFADALEAAMVAQKELATESHLAAWMELRHGEARALREQLLRARFADDAAVLAIDLHGRARDETRPILSPEPDTRPRTPRTVPPPPSRGRWLWMSAVALSLTLLGAGLGLLAGSRTSAIDPRTPADVAPEVPPPSTVVVATPPEIAAPPVVAPPEVVAPPPEVVVAAPPEVVVAPPVEAAAADHRHRTPRPPTPRTVGSVEEAAPGRLNLLAVPPAQVYLGAERLGETPLVARSLPAGRQRLEVRWGSEHRAVVVSIRSGQLTTLSVRQDTP